MQQFSKLVLHVPHSSIEGLCDPQLSFWNLTPAFYNECILPWTDWYTDYIFSPPHDRRIEMVRFPLSRFIVDAERLWNDPMANIGQGIVNTHFAKHHRHLTDTTAISQLLQHWTKHQKHLANHLANHLTEGTLLIDCHSFPSHLSDIDICIGHNDDWSKPDNDTLAHITRLFIHEGYHVSINQPYSNSITPDAPCPYKSLMIEVNKKTYLQNQSLFLDEAKATHLKATLHQLYQQLM